MASGSKKFKHQPVEVLSRESVELFNSNRSVAINCNNNRIRVENSVEEVQSDKDNKSEEKPQASRSSDVSYYSKNVHESQSFHPSLALIKLMIDQESLASKSEKIEVIENLDDESDVETFSKSPSNETDERVCKCQLKKELLKKSYQNE